MPCSPIATAIPNLVDESGTTLGVFAGEHTAEDERVARTLRAEFPKVTIRLIDTGARPRKQTSWLRAETLDAVADGKTVIYACYCGLFAFCELGKYSDKALASHNWFLINRLVRDHRCWLA